jgi:hypothetical protein
MLRCLLGGMTRVSHDKPIICQKGKCQTFDSRNHQGELMACYRRNANG